MNVNWRDMPRSHQIFIYVVGTLDALCKTGILVGGRYTLGDEARPAFDEMQAEGFTVTEDEVGQVMRALETE